MNWESFLRGDMGWAATVGLAVELARRVLKGDLVLKREYNEVVTKADTAIAKADRLVDEANAQAVKTIEAQATANAAQAKVIEVYEQQRQGGSR